MTARRAFGLLLLAVAGAAVLHSAGSTLPTPPLAEPGQLGDWWIAQGTEIAALCLVRMAGLAFCCYLALIGLLGTVTALTRWRWTLTLTTWVATPALRRMVAGGSLAVALSSTSAAAAAGPALYSVADIGAAPNNDYSLTDIGAAPTSDYSLTDIGAAPNNDYSLTDIGAAPNNDYSLTDIGAAPNNDYSLTDIGAAPDTDYSLTDGPVADTDGESVDPAIGVAADRAHPDSVHPIGGLAAAGGSLSSIAGPGSADSGLPAAADPGGDTGRRLGADSGDSADGAETWLVESGDHLWGIAADTVSQRTGAGDHMSVLRYWLKLIEANTDTVGDNPDLIHPGQLIRLPR